MRGARILRAVALGAGLAAATISLTWGLLFFRPLPTIDGYYRLLGLHERGEVIRDIHGIPRIYARDAHDLFFLQGYVTAQDRLAQMEVLRAAARATAGDAADAELSFVHAPARDALSAYAEGVTKLIRQLNEARALPGETVLVGRRTAEWTPADGLAIARAYLGSGSRCVSAPAATTVKGRPLLAADLTFDGPPPGLYEIGLADGGRRAVGISLPGVPGLVAGHNGWVAWALLDGRRSGQAVALEALLEWLAATRIDDAFVSPMGVRAVVACAADIRGVRAGALTDVPAGVADLEGMRTLLGRPAAAVGGRILIDLADVDTSRSATSHGASAHRASPHFGDQAPLWEVGQAHQLPFSRPAIVRIEGALVFRAR